MSGAAAPPDGGLSLHKLVALTDAEQYRLGAEEASRLLAAEPGNGLAWTLLSRCKLGLGDLPGALRDADEGVRLLPSLALPWRQRALALLSLERAGEAVGAARQVLELTPQDAHAHLLFAACVFGAAPDHPDVAAAALRARRLAPDDSGPHVLLGMHAHARGDTGTAGAAYRAALAIDPDLAEAHHGLALLAAAGEQDAEALRGYAATLALDPGHGSAAENLQDAARLPLVRMRWYPMIGAVAALAAAGASDPLPAGAGGWWAVRAAGLLLAALPWVLRIRSLRRGLSPQLRRLVVRQLRTDRLVRMVACGAAVSSAGTLLALAAPGDSPWSAVGFLGAVGAPVLVNSILVRLVLPRRG